MPPLSPNAVASRAVALAAEDPAAGVIDAGNGWTAEVLADPKGSDRRHLRVISPDQPEIVLTRFPASEVRPRAFPSSAPFVKSELAWAGSTSTGAVAIWISPREPAELAASVVAQSVQSGWDLHSSLNMALPALKSVTLTQAGLLRGVSVVADNVVLSDVIRK